jgi:hypothetical protein
MDMTLVSGPPLPLWFRLALLATVLWPLFWSLCVRRGGDLRVFAIVPISLNLAATSLGILHVIRVMALTGRAPHATAAGLAEALVPLAFGTVLAMLLSAFVIVKRKWQRSNRGNTVCYLVLAHAAIFVAVLAFALRVQKQSVFSPALDRQAVAVVTVSIAILLVALFTTFRSRAADPASQAWRFALFIAGNVLATAAVVIVVNTFRNFALGAA